MLLEEKGVLGLMSKTVKRVSITIEEDLLKDLDKYVELQQTINKDASRSGEICKLVEKWIPKDSP